MFIFGVFTGADPGFLERVFICLKALIVFLYFTPSENSTGAQLSVY